MANIPMKLSKGDLETPALLIDLNAMERNLERMAAFLKNKPVQLRPHFKNHRCIALARRQLAAGAIGITCATLREAESLVRNGITNILIGNEIAGRTKIRHYAELSSKGDVILAVDDLSVLQGLASYGKAFSIVVDIDVGLRRCGVATAQEALWLAEQALANGLRFRGLMGYEGRPSAERTPPEKSLQKLVDCKRFLESHGIGVEIVSASGTGNYKIAGQFPGISEIQAGSYIVMDADYQRICRDFEPVLSVLTTVVSRTAADRLVVDAGLKSISTARGMPSLRSGTGLELQAFHAEHGIVKISHDSTPLKVGDQLELPVHYGDGTIILHACMYGMRGDVVEEVLAIER